MSISKNRLRKPYFTHEINLLSISDHFVFFKLSQNVMSLIREHVLFPGMLLRSYALNQFLLFALLYGAAYILNRSICDLSYF